MADRSIGLCAAAAAVISAWASPASAAIYTYVVTGAVDADNSFDLQNLFGPDLTGASFTATFVLDDSSPTASYHYDVSGSRADGGGAFLAGTTPPMTGVIAINGHSFTIPQGDLIQVPVIDPVSGDGSGPTETEQDEANAIKDGAARSLQLDATFSDMYSCCAPATSEGSTVGSGISLNLDSLGFASPDFREVGTFALSPSSSGFFYDFYDYITRQGENSNSTDLALLPQSLTVSVSGVPEPAAWTMMVAGFAAAGIAARRRRAALPA